MNIGKHERKSFDWVFACVYAFASLLLQSKICDEFVSQENGSFKSSIKQLPCSGFLFSFDFIVWLENDWIETKMARFGSTLAFAVILIISFQRGILLTVHIFQFPDIQTGYCSSNFGESLFLISFVVFAIRFPFSIINIRFNSIYEQHLQQCRAHLWLQIWQRKCPTRTFSWLSAWTKRRRSSLCKNNT